MEQFTHFDPINLIVLLGGFIGAWYTLREVVHATRKDTNWHTEWIKKHSEEADAATKETDCILSELRSCTARLTAIADNQEKRIDRVEKYVDNVRI